MNKGVRVIYGLVQHAQTVIDNIKEILPFPISLSDHKGYIIGDSNSNRIGMLHTPSIEVLRKRKAISFDEEKIKQYENVLQGVAVPLNFHDETLGVLGIIGPPEEVWPHVELIRSEEHTSELQSRGHLVCRLLLEKKKEPYSYSPVS